MINGQDIAISQAENGFIVSVRDGSMEKGRRHADAMVFSTIEQLCGFLQQHFRRERVEFALGTGSTSIKAMPGDVPFPQWVPA